MWKIDASIKNLDAWVRKFNIHRKFGKNDTSGTKMDAVLLGGVPLVDKNVCSGLKG